MEPNGTNRRAAAGVALLFFVNGFVVGSWLPRLPEVRDRLGVDLRVLGLTLALGGLGSLVGSASSGLVIGRFGARRSSIIPAGILYLLLPLLAVAPTPVLFAALLAAMGMIDAQADVGMNAVGIRIEERVGRSIMTRLHGLWSLGTLAGAGVCALAVANGIDLGPQLVFVSVIGLITVLVASPSIPDSTPRLREGRTSGKLAIGLMLAGGTAVFIEGAPFDWSAIFLTDVLGTTGALAGAGLIVYTAGMLGGRLAGDHLVDRFGALRTLYSGVTLAALSTWLVVSAGQPFVALVGFASWGLGVAVVVPVLYKLAGSHRSFNEGAGLAALTVGTRLGFMIAPAIIGSAAQAWGLSTALAFVITVAGVATSIAIGLTLGVASTGDSLPTAEDS